MARRFINFNDNWSFSKNTGSFETVNIPHTWNAIDGQDGGNDYYRGTCCYTKLFQIPDYSEDEQVWIEFDGVNSSATVVLNSCELGQHDGGYSTFRFRIDQYLAQENEIKVFVDNSVNSKVYPQTADFTFYGGIYRDVRLIVLSKNHFAFGKYGGNGVKLTPVVSGKNGVLQVETWITGEYDNVRVVLYDGEKPICRKDGACCNLEIPDVHLWNGVDDPFLYNCTVDLCKAGLCEDRLEYKIGFRTIDFDPDKGCFLNGRSYPLRGVSRHQDREGVGNALLPWMHDEDMSIILESGANSVRLAHYQHSSYFYSLCDKFGILCWAEIPYITKHMDGGFDNTISQISELIEQNYNHTSVFCWSISNEITAGGNSEAVYENNVALYKRCHEMDGSRPVAMAHAFMLPISDKTVSLPDIIGYNLYYGWYLGNIEGNGAFLDAVHREHPALPVGLTEFGCDANTAFQTSNPVKGDYSEQYQAKFHEQLCADIDKRPYLWGTYIWNMFDFAADARDEGGTRGRNCKGLVSFDRKTKKDSFYLVKAWYSKEPFVYICGKRYINRCEDSSEIRVYSNRKSIELLCNGKSLGIQEGEHCFVFNVQIRPYNPALCDFHIEAKSGSLSDSIDIKRVPVPDKSYLYSSSEYVANWFEGLDVSVSDGVYSIHDTVGEIRKTENGKKIVDEILSMRSEEKEGVAAAVEMTDYMKEVTMKDVRLSEILHNAKVPAATVKKINQKLSKIPRV